MIIIAYVIGIAACAAVISIMYSGQAPATVKEITDIVERSITPEQRQRKERVRAAYAHYVNALEQRQADRTDAEKRDAYLNAKHTLYDVVRQNSALITEHGLTIDVPGNTLKRVVGMYLDSPFYD